MNNLRDITGMPEYDVQFWNMMRGFRGNEDVLSKGRIIATNSYALPVSAIDKISTALKKESVFRNLATVIKAYNTGYLIKTKDCTDIANFIPENCEIPVKDGMKDFNEKSIESYKLASFVKLDGALVKDAAFSIENGNEPIAFGDFFYYWIVDRKATYIRTLVELFAELGQNGYLVYKFLDAKLIRKEAIKVIQMGTTE